MAPVSALTLASLLVRLFGVHCILLPFLLNVAKSDFMFTARALQLPSNGTAVFFFFGADAGPGEDSCLCE